MVKIVMLVLLAEVFGAIGQLLFKKSTNTLGAHTLRGVDTHFRFLTEVLSRPTIWFGFLAMGASLVVWLAALARGELSIVFSIGSLQYILILFLAHIYLGEKIDRMKLLGTFLVVFGIVLITIS